MKRQNSTKPPPQDDSKYIPFQPPLDLQVAKQSKESYIKSMWDFVSTHARLMVYWIMHPFALYQTLSYRIMDTSYILLLAFFAINYYILILLFCLLIYLFSFIEEECVKAGDGSLADMKNSGQIFSVLFALSWTTISTVGYGNTWPALSEEDAAAVMHCSAVNILLMVSAFSGVCFAGACGAILLGKVVQVKNQAQVEFSQTMVVRFGSGLVDIEDDNDIADGEANSFTNSKEGMPCPVLEFRLVNKLHHISRGVITDASISCAIGIHEYADEEDESKTDEMVLQTSDSLLSSSFRSRDKIQRISLPKKIFLDLNIVNARHPHFKRCWTAAHILDENSPLLSSKMKARIKKNKGKWPIIKDKKYSTARFIKDNIYFEELIVSFNGVSKHVSAEVSAQKVYNSCDVVIGYQFVPILEKHGNDVHVLVDCLNDVAYQNGTDEPLPIEYCI